MIIVDALEVQRGRSIAVDSITANIRDCAWTGIVGANGSGKTSLLKALAGRLETSGGTIEIDGAKSLVRLDRAQRVGFAPDVAALPASLTGLEVLTLMREDDPAPASRLADLRDALELERLETMPIAAMSAGMRQRISIFAAFVRNVRTIILDEPFNWLDPVCTFDVKEVLRRMTRSDGICLITALHDFGTLTTYCDEGLILSAGRIVRRLDQDDLKQGYGDLAGFEARLIETLRPTIKG